MAVTRTGNLGHTRGLPTKDSPAGRFMRTVFLGLAGILLSNQTLDLFTDFKTNGTFIVLQLIAVLIAGVIAFLQAYSGTLNDSTPLGKTIKQFVQVFLSGSGVLVVTDLTVKGGLAFAHAFGSLAWTAFLSAVVVYLTNVAEDANA